MGYFSDRRIERAVRRAHAALEAGKAEPFAELDSLEESEQIAALTRVADELLAGERLADARGALERALAIAPESWEALGVLAQLERESDRRPEAIAAYERMLAADPGNPDVSADLAQVLIVDGQLDRAVTMLRALEPDQHPGVALRLGEALVAAGKLEEALTGLSKVRELYGYRLQHGGMAGDSADTRQQMAEAARLHDAIEAELQAAGEGGEAPADDAEGGDAEGPEARQEHEALTFTGVGLKLMAESPPLARELAVATPDETAARAEATLADTPDDPDALCLLGSAWLRRNKPGRARDVFERARAADGHCFAAYLGLGAVLAWERHDLPRVAAGLAASSDVEGLKELMPDWAALTELERDVAAASAQPLGALVATAARAGARVRVLPIDVRPADLEPGAATVRVEDLLDVETPAGWSVAQAVGRLVFPHVPAPVRAEVEALHARAAAAPRARAVPLADYFARGYAEFLRWRHGRTELRAPDDEIAEELLGVCRRLVAAAEER
ncbi:MAG TPA: tetratricopeptide repeat protein [Polyangia bacterium]|jgi:tetratricopeptide (TPR) repeat protein